MRPRRAPPCTLSRRQSSPSKRIEPRNGARPEMARSVDDFPAPFGPMTATTSRSPTRKSIPRTAWTGPYDTSTPRSSSTACCLFVHTEVRVDDAVIFEHGGGGADGNEAAQLKHRDAVAQRGDEVELVVDEQHGHALALQASQMRDQLIRLGGVESCRR